MTRLFFTKTIALVGSLLLLGAGCIQFTGTGAGADGGVFKSVDEGESWSQKSSIASTQGARTIAGLNITSLVQDPSDSKAVYAGTDSQGLFYTLDGAESWQQASELGRIRVNVVAVSPGDKCVIFVATGNRVVRSTDCTRTWRNVYFDPRPETLITDIVVDFFNSDTIYAGTSRGDLLKSVDRGGSWSPAHRFDNNIRQVLMSPSDSRVLYVATHNRGLWKTSDSGQNWMDLTPNLGDYSGAIDRMIMASDPATPSALVLGSHYGLLRTTDGGAGWSPIPLLTPPGSTAIYSLAVSPADSKAIYYGTASTFYRTIDGGVRWITATNPTTRGATTLLVDAEDDRNLYLGTTLLKQSGGFGP